MRQILILLIAFCVIYQTSAKPGTKSNEAVEFQYLDDETPISVEKRAWNFNSRGYNRGYKNRNTHAQFKRQLYDYMRQNKNAYSEKTSE